MEGLSASSFGLHPLGHFADLPPSLWTGLLAIDRRNPTVETVLRYKYI